MQEIVFDEVNSLEAGVPYVFLATGSELNLTLTGEAVAEPNNTTSNGLVGSFEVKKVGASVNNYVLSNNLLYCTKNHDYYVGENRAYFDISSMFVFDSSAPKAPGRRRVRLAVEQEQVLTGMDELNAPAENSKMVLDGRLVIIHNGMYYDATGRRIQ